MILIAIPTNKYIEKECFQAIYDLDTEGLDCQLYIQSAYAVDVAREKIVIEAKKRNAEYIFWVDSDTIPPKNALKDLLSCNKDIVSGIYAFKYMDSDDAVVMRINGDHYENITVTELLQGERIKEIDACGFGCILTKTDVFREQNFIYDTRRGEDTYFCEKAKVNGYKIYVDNRVGCGHKGDIFYNVEGIK